VAAGQGNGSRIRLAITQRFTAIASNKKWLAACVLIFTAVAARVAWSAWIAHSHPAAVTSGDTPDYLASARALIETRHFNLSPSDPTPMFLRTPGYPAALAAVWWVTGSQWALSPIQAGLGIITIALVVLVGRRVAGTSVGLLAGVLVALDPLQFALSGTLLSEMLDGLLLAAVVAVAGLVFVRTPKHVRPVHLAALGLTIAAATMVRPTLWFFPVIAVGLVVWHFRSLPRRKLIGLVLAFILPIAVVVGGWEVRNHRAVGSWQLAGTAGVTLYCYNAAEVNAHATGVSLKASRRDLGCNPSGWDDLKKSCPSWWGCDVQHPLANGKGFDEMSHRGVRIMARHPVETAEVFVAGLLREVFGPGTDTVGRFLHVRSSPLLTTPLFVWNLALWSLAFVGAFVGLRSRLRAFWSFTVSLVLYNVIVSAGFESGARFRAPVMPIVALMAAVGLVAISEQLRAPTAAIEHAHDHDDEPLLDAEPVPGH
jgi:4-amino-4-deoxy-L-arabinose transferase-like glycosyltransferase